MRIYLLTVFEKTWFSGLANKVRSLVKTCPKNCWMAGTAAPVMEKYISKVGLWFIESNLKKPAWKTD